MGAVCAVGVAALSVLFALISVSDVFGCSEMCKVGGDISIRTAADGSHSHVVAIFSSHLNVPFSISTQSSRDIRGANMSFLWVDCGYARVLCEKSQLST